LRETVDHVVREETSGSDAEKESNLLARDELLDDSITTAIEIDIRPERCSRSRMTLPHPGPPFWEPGPSFYQDVTWWCRRGTNAGRERACRLRRFAQGS
jgi:hypothetical protein